MATIPRTPVLLLPTSSLTISSIENPRTHVNFSFSKQRASRPLQMKLSHLPFKPSISFPTFVPFAASEETIKAEEVDEVAAKEDTDDEAAAVQGVNDEDVAQTEDMTASVLMATLQSYKEALANDDQSTVSDIEAFLQSLEDEKSSLASKVAALSAELSIERDRVLRISADFDNFRKRTERERLSLMSNVQGEVVESMLPVLDNFERANTQIKVETEGEGKINSSYQSIYKQFLEVLTSLGVEAVDTVGSAFDPLLHEAIMQEESTEYEEGIIVQEFRKGFKLGDRLLRPSMVKVSAGPGPDKSGEDEVPPVDDALPSADKEETEEADVDDADDQISAFC